MKHRFIITLIIATTSPLAAQTPLVKRLGEQLAEQRSHLNEMEQLHMSYDNPRQQPASTHEFRVRLDGPIQVVTERHTEDGQLTEKDYFLHDDKVYAFNVTHQDFSMDGKTKRIAESQFLFDSGAPIHRTFHVARMPKTDPALKPGKTPNRELPLPSGLEGWGDKLTARAFDIARSFRPGVGRYVFGDWDVWLLKNAPPAGSSEKPLRKEDWLPSPDTLVLPILQTESPDGLFAIGWGYEKGPVEWGQLSDSGHNPDFGEVSFSTKLSEIELKPPLSEDTNFLVNALNNKPLGNLGVYHQGERKRFNHDECAVEWSPSATCFIVRETGKWEDNAAGIGWIKEGRCNGTYDILKPLQAAANAALVKSKDPAAKRLHKGEDDDPFSFSISGLLLDDDGHVEARVLGQIPKDEEPGGLYWAIIEGTLSPATTGSEAVLKTSKVKIIAE